jgi:hypothetical protein
MWVDLNKMGSKENLYRTALKEQNISSITFRSISNIGHL